MRQKVEGAAVKSTLVRNAKDFVKSNPFASAYSIAESRIVTAARVANQRSIQHFGRIGNRHRQRCHPRHQTDLNFELDTAHVPSQFTVSDVTSPSAHPFLHRQAAAAAGMWTVMVKASFKQLWSIRDFVRADDSIRQLPLAFVRMMLKRASDYCNLLQVLCSPQSTVPYSE